MFGTARLVFGLTRCHLRSGRLAGIGNSRFLIALFSDLKSLISNQLSNRISNIWAINYASRQVLRKHPVYSTPEYPGPSSSTSIVNILSIIVVTVSYYYLILQFNFYDNAFTVSCQVLLRPSLVIHTDGMVFLCGAPIKQVGLSEYLVFCAEILIPKFPGNYDRCAVIPSKT